MKNVIPDVRQALAEQLGDLMSGLEDLCDDIRDLLDEEEDSGALRAALEKMDQALDLLCRAADALEENARNG